MSKLRDQVERGAIPEPNSGCMLWCRSVDSSGYGKIGGGKRGTIGAHRAAWMVYRGPIPNGMYVCHRCDVRSCVNPDHLFLGTNADNLADMAEKGRAFRSTGETSALARLTTAQVLAIRGDGRSSLEIAAQYGISRGHVSQLKTRSRWKHLT